VIIDNRLAVIGSMNLDLRSQLQNSEVALLIRSATLSREATRQIEATLAHRRLPRGAAGRRGGLARPARRQLPRRVAGAYADAMLRLLVNMIGPEAGTRC
jgi:putative cardiolipin synthase